MPKIQNPKSIRALQGCIQKMGKKPEAYFVCKHGILIVKDIQHGYSYSKYHEQHFDILTGNPHAWYCANFSFHERVRNTEEDTLPDINGFIVKCTYTLKNQRFVYHEKSVEQFELGVLNDDMQTLIEETKNLLSGWYDAFENKQIIHTHSRWETVVIPLIQYLLEQSPLKEHQHTQLWKKLFDINIGCTSTLFEQHLQQYPGALAALIHTLESYCNPQKHHIEPIENIDWNMHG